jgi:hypothetical protein
MLSAVCICDAACESACRGKAYDKFGATSKSNSPAKDKEE